MQIILYFLCLVLFYSGHGIDIHVIATMTNDLLDGSYQFVVYKATVLVYTFAFSSIVVFPG